MTVTFTDTFGRIKRKSRIFSSLVQKKGEPVVSLYFIIMSRARLRVIPHSVVCLNIKKHLA